MNPNETMIHIKVIMNSSVEEILSFKCCNLHGQNLEIHLTHPGPEPLSVHGHCDLLGDREGERYRVANLFPPGPYRLLPGEPLACYASLEEEVFRRYRWIVFQDLGGEEHRAALERPAPDCRSGEKRE